jgi:hypothetical protein
MTRNRAGIVFGMLLVLASLQDQTALAQSKFVERDVLRHSDLRALADDAEKLSDSFKNHLDRELDHTIIDGTSKEKKFEQRASKLENALDDVRSAVRDGNKFNRTRDRVKRALQYAQELDREMARLPHSRELEDHWRQLLGRLDQLAFFYELPVARS